MSKKPVGIGAFIRENDDGTFTITVTIERIEGRDKAALVGAWLCDLIVPRLQEIGMTPIDLGKPN
jgi:hypothetical protein